MKICPDCKKEYSDDVEFCLDDGAVLVDSEEMIEAATASATADAASPDTPVADEAQTAETKADDRPATVATSTASKDKGMSAMAKGMIVLLVMLAIGAGLVVWKNKYGGHHGVAFNKMTKEEMELLLKDANPMMLKRLAEDPELKKQQIESLKQLLAIASAAQRDPSVYDTNTQRAMEIIDSVIWARSYDQEINKDKGPMPPFGFITEDRVNAFYNEGADAKVHEAEFQNFFKTQLDFAKKNKAIPEDREPSEEEIKQMRDQFAKIKIYEKEAKEKVQAAKGTEEEQKWQEFARKVELQSKLQQAQFLSRIYSQEVLAKKAQVTDAEIEKYLQEHPELTNAGEKRTKAEEVLNRAKAGEDFANLAKEFSEDPGSKEKGGFYEGVSKGQFMPEFETAALGLEPGQVAPNLVETAYGYHIIKLERKGEAKDQNGQVRDTYDVRHILFSTTVKDPENPMAREMPVKDFVRQKLEAEKEKKVLDELLAKYPVEIPEDFTIPQVSEEQMQEMMNQQMQQMQQLQQMQNPEGGETNADSDKSKTPKKPDAKKGNK